jgi:HEAT repeat protein
MRSVLKGIPNLRRVAAAFLIAVVASALAPWAQASEVSDGLEQLDAIVREAGSTETFLSESPQGQVLRDRYYQQWLSMYPQGESQFPRPNFDAVIAQARKAVREHPELGTRLFETSGLGKTFQVQIDAESSGLELKQGEWKSFYEGWRKRLEQGSVRIRKLDDKARASELQQLSSELESELVRERARIQALPKDKKLERGTAEAELQKRLLNDPRTQELASFAVHEKVFGEEGEALRDILNSGDADQMLMGMKQIQQKGNLPIPESLHSIVVKSAVPALEQPKLELDGSGKAAESELFRVKLRKTNRGKLVPEGRVARTTLEFQAIPRRIHGLFKGISIRECVGGGSCESLSPERWGTIALQDSQLHLVVENGSLTPGFTHGVPVKVGEQTFLSMDIQAPALNKTGVKNTGASVEKVAAYPLWLKEQQKQLPTRYRKMLVGSSTAMSNGGNRPTVTSSNSYLLGRSLETTRGATVADARIRRVLLEQAGGNSRYNYGGNLITETTVQKAGALTQLLPSLETLSEAQVISILERGRPEFRLQLMKSERLPSLRKRYPALGKSRSYWQLLEWGLSHEEQIVRAAAARSLSSESGPEALKLKAKAIQDQDLEVRRAAAESLSKESGPEALKLKAKAMKHQDHAVRLAAAVSLSKESGPDALKVKAKAMKHQDHLVRVQAAGSLSNESGPEALKVKAKALDHSDRYVRRLAAESLSRESGPEALKLQAKAMKDSHSDVRAAAQSLRIAPRSAPIQPARGVEAVPPSRGSSAGATSVKSGLAQSLMSVIMNQDLQERGLEGQAGYHFIQGIGDADSVMDLTVKKPLQSRGLQLARSGLGLAARGIGIYGAGMSAAQLRQALADGDAGGAVTAGAKTSVLGGSALRQFAKPVAGRLLTEGGGALARRAGSSGAAKVLGTATGPVGLTALAVGDIGAMAMEWRAVAYYGSIEKIYSQSQQELLRFGPGFEKSVMTNAGIRASLKHLQTNIEPEMRDARFQLEAKALSESLAMREVLGLSTEPMGADTPTALAEELKSNGAFNPLASNVPQFIKDLCKRGELTCKRTEKRYAVGMGGVGSVAQSSYEAEVEDYSVAMADYLLKEKAKAKAKFEKEWKEALTSGKADADWLAFIQEKEKLEREYAPRLQKEAEELTKKMDATPDEQTPLQKEYAGKIDEAYARTMRAAQLVDSMLEHAGIDRHVTAAEKKQLRDSVNQATAGGKSGPQTIKSLQSELVALESQALSRKTGIPAEQIRSNPVEARLTSRKQDFREGMKAEGIEVEQLPSGVRDAVDEVLKRKLELEAKTGLLEEASPEVQAEMDQANLQLEALLYGIQMGKREPPLTEARVEDYARRFLGAGSGERKAASITSEAAEQLEKALTPEEQVGRGDRREFEQRSRTRGATQSVSPQKKPEAAAGASSSVRSSTAR